MRTGKLTALQADRANKRGYLNDGGGLYLRVAERGSKSWMFRFSRDGKHRWMGLGPFPDVTLAEARGKATEARRALLEGKDPIQERRASKAAAAKALTFRECAEAFISAQAPGWRNGRSQAQWESSLAAFVFPIFGNMAVDAIDTGLVMRAL